MIPVIALVGRPNVGKSTLFNRLTRTQNALVADFPGLTRDRQYGNAIFNSTQFIVVDTGGIGVDNLLIDGLMSEQSAIALQEANYILLLLDARAGLTSVDEEIALQLRKLNKPIYPIINKIDGINEHILSAEFQQLGLGQMCYISATHGHGIDGLLKTITSKFIQIDHQTTPEISASASKNIKITFVGRPNVGKSTLVNRMLGEHRVVVCDIPGTTRDSIKTEFIRDTQRYTLTDTAGIRRRARVTEKIEKFSIIKTLQSIKESNICLLVLDALEGITDQDMHVLRFVIEAGKGLVIIVNKWDNLDMEHKQQIKNELTRRLRFVSFAKIRFISALYGSGVQELWSDIRQAYVSSMVPLCTSELTRLLQDFITRHSPPRVNGRQVKMRYAHSGGNNPPIIVIHGNQLDNLLDSYKQYLINSFSKSLGLIGTSLKLEFKTNINPFQDKKNELNLHQIKKKRRLMTFVRKKRL